MDGGNEQRVAIKFCFKAGLSATEILVLVQKAYWTEALNWSNVFRRYSRIRDEKGLVGSDDRGDRSKSTGTEVNIAAVADLVKNYCRIASRMIAESLNILKTVVLRILKEDLGKRKLFARIVLHSLILEQREVRVTSFQDIIALADADKKCSQKYCGWWDLVFCLWPRNKATEFWMVWWAEGTEIPKVPHVDTPSKRIF